MHSVAKCIFTELLLGRNRGNSKTDKIIRLEYLKPISMGIT